MSSSNIFNNLIFMFRCKGITTLNQLNLTFYYKKNKKKRNSNQIKEKVFFFFLLIDQGESYSY